MYKNDRMYARGDWVKRYQKIIISGLSCFFLLALFSCTWIFYQGYKMYQDAIKETPIVETIEKIKEKPNYVLLKDIPIYYRQAVIAIEDHRFYKHHGFDLIAFSRAVLHNLLEMSLVEGGSTITQQLAKNQFFTQEKRFERKVAEVFLAHELEKLYSKDEILELYINTIYYGNGLYGIAEASEAYFQKLPEDLTIAESTLLVGIPNAPSVYSLKENEQLAHQRQKQVLQKMIKYKYLTQAEANEILSVPVSLFSRKEAEGKNF